MFLLLDARNLHSARRHYLVVLDTVSARMGVGHFAVVGPTAWNSLSDDLRDPTLSTDSFRRLLTTRLFSEYQYIEHIRRITLYEFTTYLLTYSTVVVVIMSLPRGVDLW